MIRDAKLRLKFDTTLPDGQPIAAEMIVHGRWYSGCMATLEQPAEDPEIDYVRVEAVNFDQHYAEQVLDQWQNEHGLVEEQPDWEIDYD